jgi:hypothetical protein
LDVEGHEFKVLAGAGNLIELYQPSIIIEVLDSSFGEKLLPFIEKVKDYSFYKINDIDFTLSPCKNFDTKERSNFLITTHKYD